MEMPVIDESPPGRFQRYQIVVNLDCNSIGNMVMACTLQ